MSPGEGVHWEPGGGQVPLTPLTGLWGIGQASLLFELWRSIVVAECEHLVCHHLLHHAEYVRL